MHYYDIPPTIINHYRIGTDGSEYLATYEPDEESMKEMWALFEKYYEMNSGLVD